MLLENIQLLNPVKAAIETVENPKEMLKDDTLHAVTYDPLEDQDNRESQSKLSRKRKWTRLHDACEEGNLTKVRGLLLINNANIDARSKGLIPTPEKHHQCTSKVS